MQWKGKIGIYTQVCNAGYTYSTIYSCDPLTKTNETGLDKTTDSTALFSGQIIFENTQV